MKVLMINSYYDKGGAARAALRLSEALQRSGTDVCHKSIYPKRMSFSGKVFYYVRVLFDRLPACVVAKKKVMFSSGQPSNRRVVEEINSGDADIVHLNWVNAGALSIGDIEKINKKVVWTPHDMWPFTGGCHYDEGCGKYKVGCGACPILKSKKNNDISFYQNKKKVESYGAAKDMTVVALSGWMEKSIKSSFVMSKKNVVNLPNAIDVDVFFPYEKDQARAAFKLSPDKKYVLFGAVAAIDDPRKGYQQLINALRLLPSSSDIEILIFGSDSPNDSLDFGFTTHYLGHVSDDNELSLLYGAADVMVVPSLQEAFGQTAAEAMACGTPAVAFGATGLLDIIDHKINGYLAEPFNSQSLAEGISWILNYIDYESLCKQARQKVMEEFSYLVVAHRYNKMYRDILDGKTHGNCIGDVYGR